MDSIHTTRGTGSNSPFYMSGVTSVGAMRPVNQDAFLVRELQDSRVGFVAIVAVADGMGGHGQGEIASRLVIDEISKIFVAEQDALVDCLTNPSSSLKELTIYLNHSLREYSTDNSIGIMGTTLSLVLVTQNQAIVTHIGDSRIYRWRNSRIDCLTQDHSWIREQLQSGKVTQQEADRHPLRNRLTQGLGTKMTVDPDITLHTIFPGDRLLLCTDGLYRVVLEEDIVHTLNSEASLSVCQSLVDLAYIRGGADDATVAFLAVKD